MHNLYKKSDDKSDKDLEDETFKDKFPDKWQCPYCAYEKMHSELIERDDILNHVISQHGDDVPVDGLSWEILYLRMTQVGGV